MTAFGDARENTAPRARGLRARLLGASSRACGGGAASHRAGRARWTRSASHARLVHGAPRRHRCPRPVHDALADGLLSLQRLAGGARPAGGSPDRTGARGGSHFARRRGALARAARRHRRGSLDGVQPRAVAHRQGDAARLRNVDSVMRWPTTVPARRAAALRRRRRHRALNAAEPLRRGGATQ